MAIKSAIKRVNQPMGVKKHGRGRAPKLGSIHPIKSPKVGGPWDARVGPNKGGPPTSQFGMLGFKPPQIGSVTDPKPAGHASMQGINPLFTAGKVSGKKAQRKY